MWRRYRAWDHPPWSWRPGTSSVSSVRSSTRPSSARKMRARSLSTSTVQNDSYTSTRASNGRRSGCGPTVARSRTGRDVAMSSHRPAPCAENNASPRFDPRSNRSLTWSAMAPASCSTERRGASSSSEARSRMRCSSPSRASSKSCLLGRTLPSTDRYTLVTGTSPGVHSASLRRNARSSSVTPTSPRPAGSRSRSLDRDLFEGRRALEGLDPRIDHRLHREQQLPARGHEVLDRLGTDLLAECQRHADGAEAHRAHWSSRGSLLGLGCLPGPPVTGALLSHSIPFLCQRSRTPLAAHARTGPPGDPRRRTPPG